MQESPATNTTRKIAFSLMALFGICLITSLATAVYFYSFGEPGHRDEKWLSTFKDGFAFLAGALATIIGYYFGHRNTDVAFDRAREATEKARDATQQVAQEEAKNKALKMEIVEVSRSNDPIGAGPSPVRSEDALPAPRIEKPEE